MKKRFVIIGAGITGLTIAYLLNKKYGSLADITILESSSLPGGLIQCRHSGGFKFDLGPKGFLTKGEGVLTSQLAQELRIPLLSCNKAAKNRFIRFNNRTRKIGLLSLLSQGLIPSLFKDLKTKPFSGEESVEDFFHRHATPKMVKNILTPITTGIRAGYPETLSATLAFPSLKQREAKHGSLLKSFLHDCISIKKTSRKSTQSMLATPAQGMSMFIDALLKNIPVPPVYHERVEKISLTSQILVHTKKSQYIADTIIYTGPLHTLSTLLPQIHMDSILEKTKNRSLACLSLGWNSPNILNKKGYGMLVADEAPILGIVWTTEIFPNLAPEKSQVAILFDRNLNENEALKIGILRIKKYLGITTPPDAYAYAFAPEGIPQLKPGFAQELQILENVLPASIKIAGQNIAGPGVNRCIASAYNVVSHV